MNAFDGSICLVSALSYAMDDLVSKTLGCVRLHRHSRKQRSMLCCVGWHRCGGSRRRSVFVRQIREGFQGRADGNVSLFKETRMAFLELIMARVTNSAKKSYKVGQVAHIQLA